ncbi:hypothetical protein [Vreelandella aquamarina]|uniref:hypothetical protein n=1 Tax=Vreelandella aquamarina TaxID=77097 RepID=UPI00384C5C6D
MRHYSLAEAVLSKLTPLRWCEDTGTLVMDQKALTESGAHCEVICLILTLVFSIATFLMADLLFAGSASAKLGTLLFGLLSATFMVTSICIRLRRLRSC